MKLHVDGKNEAYIIEMDLDVVQCLSIDNANPDNTSSIP